MLQGPTAGPGQGVIIMYWISFKKALPKVEEWIVIWMFTPQDQPYIGKYTEDGKIRLENGEEYGTGLFTHWHYVHKPKES